MWGTNRERWSQVIGRKSLAWWVITTHGRRRRDNEARLADPAYADAPGPPLPVVQRRPRRGWPQPERSDRLERVERGPDRARASARRRRRRRAAWRSIAHSSARRQPDPVDRPRVLLGQRDVGDRRVVGRERDRDAEPVEAGERVVLDRGDDAGLDVRGRAEVERRRRGRSARGRGPGRRSRPGRGRSARGRPRARGGPAARRPTRRRGP